MLFHLNLFKDYELHRHHHHLKFQKQNSKQEKFQIRNSRIVRYMI